MARLVIDSSEDVEAAELDGRCVAGRLASCGLTLNEPQSSRKHFEVRPAGARWTLLDLGSRNGTFLNDERLAEKQQTSLQHGDVIRVGETRVRYECGVRPLSAGLELGNVVLEAVAGRSDYGLLYDGRQPSLDRDVTVEVLDPDRANDPAARERYQQRARAAGAFEHSSVVAVFDVAATEHAVYTVFEALPKQSLEEQLGAGKRYSREDALTLLRLLAEALHHVHAREKLHGCLCASSVRLEAELKVKLHGLGEPPGDRLRPFQQRADELACYASPEEARGGKPTPASDIYSLGLLACRLLGGALPLPDRKREAALAHHAAPDPLDLTGLGLDEDVRVVIERFVAKDPPQRPDPREATGLFLELGGGGLLSASSAIRRRQDAKGRASAKLEDSGRARGDSARARARGDSARGRGDSARARGDSARGDSARGRGDSARARKRDSSGGVARKGSARQKKKQPVRPDSAPAKPGSGPVRGASGSGPARPPSSESSSVGVAPRRGAFSDRALAPEPPWALPARLGLVGAGYVLMFLAAFLLARIGMHLVS